MLLFSALCAAYLVYRASGAGRPVRCSGRPPSSMPASRCCSPERGAGRERREALASRAARPLPAARRRALRGLASRQARHGPDRAVAPDRPDPRRPAPAPDRLRRAVAAPADRAGDAGSAREPDQGRGPLPRGPRDGPRQGRHHRPAGGWRRRWSSSPRTCRPRTSPRPRSCKAWFAQNTKLVHAAGAGDLPATSTSPPDRRGKSAWSDAGKALAKLAGKPADWPGAAALGDPFMFQDYLADRTPDQIAKDFGPLVREGPLRPEAGRVDRARSSRATAGTSSSSTP